MERPPSAPLPAAVAGEAEFAEAQRVHKIPAAAWKRRLDERLTQMPQQFSLSWLKVRFAPSMSCHSSPTCDPPLRRR